jgi:hypothetical protein
MATEILSAEDIAAFETRGYVVVHGCLSAEQLHEWCARARQRLASSPQDARAPRAYLHATCQIPLSECSLRAWEAICQLLGGVERIQPGYVWDSFIVNQRMPEGREWQPPSANAEGWHIDGDSFRHFLDSPEQALVALFHWTAALPGGGATYVACDSVPVMARFLAEHPEGLLPREFPYGQLVKRCRVFREIEAEAGDVLLLHPLTLHAASMNSLGIPRIITNSNLQLRHPKRLDQPALLDYSPVERAIVAGLGVERYRFVPAGPRERFTSPRVLEARQEREAEGQP